MLYSAYEEYHCSISTRPFGVLAYRSLIQRRHHRVCSPSPGDSTSSCSKSLGQHSTPRRQSCPVILHSRCNHQVRHNCYWLAIRLSSAQFRCKIRVIVVSLEERIELTPAQAPKFQFCGTGSGSASATGAACIGKSSAKLAMRIVGSCMSVVR